MAEAYIYDSVRTPRGKGKPDGALHEVTSLRAAATVLEAIRDRNGLDTALVEDVILGCVTGVGEQGADIARTAALYAGYDERAPGLHINRFCASGIEAVNLAANQIKGGDGELYVAGGVEMMSRVPMGSDGFALALDPVSAYAAYFAPQGVAADLIATKYGFSRTDCDALAVESHKRAAQAWAEGRFAKSIVPVRDVNGVTILDRDETIRPNTTLEALAGLKASFREQGEVMPGFDAVLQLKYPEIERINHVHHAGNSSGVVDGAAAILVGSKAIGEKLGLRPRARIRASVKVGSDPSIMLTGPVPATEKILARAGMSINDIDLFEVNEAFAAVVLRFLQAFQVDPAKVNVNGGAMAMGHPLGATGAMIIGTALDELERTGEGTALCTLCVASGMGAGILIERV